MDASLIVAAVGSAACFFGVARHAWGKGRQEGFSQGISCMLMEVCEGKISGADGKVKIGEDSSLKIFDTEVGDWVKELDIETLRESLGMIRS